MSDGTYSTTGPKCPYCGRQYVADDPNYYDEMNYTSETCDGCGKKFEVRVATTTCWECDPIEEGDDEPKIVNVGDELHTILADALKRNDA